MTDKNADYERLLSLSVPKRLTLEVVAEAMQKIGIDVNKIRSAASKTNTKPTDEQKESGNYKKGKFSWHGLTIVVETPKGAVRSGKTWAITLKDHYGYIDKTESDADGDEVDVFVCEEHPDSELVFIVNQKKKDGTFDEHKCVIGCISLEQAKKVYLRNYSPGWTGMGEVTPITVDHFKWWLENADTSKEIKNGYFAVPSNRKPEKTAADPTTGMQPVTSEDEELKAILAEKRYLSRYKCPHCGGTNMYNGIPGTGITFRGSGHCQDCDKRCSIVGLKLKPIGDGPELKITDSQIANWRKNKKMERKLSKSAFEIYEPCLFLVKRADDSDDRPFTICVDFDGTLAESQKEFDPNTCGDPRYSAIEWVKAFHRAGARIIVFTVRGKLEPVKAWLKEHDVPYDYINENPDQPKNSSGKVFADLYWDDKAWNAENPDEHGPTILAKVLAHNDKEPDSNNSPVIMISKQIVIRISGPDVMSAMEHDDAA